MWRFRHVGSEGDDGNLRGIGSVESGEVRGKRERERLWSTDQKERANVDTGRQRSEEGGKKGEKRW